MKKRREKKEADTGENVIKIKRKYVAYASTLWNFRFCCCCCRRCLKLNCYFATVHTQSTKRNVWQNKKKMKFLFLHILSTASPKRIDFSFYLKNYFTEKCKAFDSPDWPYTVIWMDFIFVIPNYGIFSNLIAHLKNIDALPVNATISMAGKETLSLYFHLRISIFHIA